MKFLYHHYLILHEIQTNKTFLKDYAVYSKLTQMCVEFLRKNSVTSKEVLSFWSLSSVVFFIFFPMRLVLHPCFDSNIYVGAWVQECAGKSLWNCQRISKSYWILNFDTCELLSYQKSLEGSFPLVLGLLMKLRNKCDFRVDVEVYTFVFWRV